MKIHSGHISRFVKGLPSKILSWVVILFLGLVTNACGQKNFSEKLKSIYEYTVPQVKPSELKKWMDNNDPMVLLDTRSPQEYQTSHLKRARFVDYENFEINQIADIPKNKKVVIYCAVGYRSERVGEKLQNAGYKNVYNLYGGIFEWKNEGYTVVNNQKKPTDSVHTYSRRWSQYLKNGIQVYE